MQIEHQKHLGAAPHERIEERTGHANGYKDKTLHTRLGQITVAVPQSCLRLVSALLMEVSDDWQAGKADLTFSQ